jgi:hypothetical protein
MRLTEERNRILEMMGLLKENLLTEGRYSTTVNDITKDVMRQVINFIESDENYFEWENYYVQESHSEEFDFDYDDEDEDDEEDDSIETFMVFLNIEKNDEEYPYNIDAYQEWNDDEGSESIVTNIEINPDIFKGKIINDFQAELKDMFRHEIEHLYQSVNPNKRVKFINTKSFVKDVLQPAEIDAYLQGFYTQAKTKKVTMNQIIDEWIEQRKKHFKNKKDMDKVRTEFIKHGKKLFPKAKWI